VPFDSLDGASQAVDEERTDVARAHYVGPKHRKIGCGPAGRRRIAAEAPQKAPARGGDSVLRSTAAPQLSGQAPFDENAERRIDRTGSRPPSPAGPLGDPSRDEIPIDRAFALHAGQRVETDDTGWHTGLRALSGTISISI